MDPHPFSDVTLDEITDGYALDLVMGYGDDDDDGTPMGYVPQDQDDADADEA